MIDEVARDAADVAADRDTGRVDCGAVGRDAVDAPARRAPADGVPPELGVLDGAPFSFINGPAGTGKTFLARAWAAASPGLTLTATTGIAAINMGDATTINALLKYYDTASLEEAYTAGFLQATLRKLRKAGLRRILLDEVSMLDGHQLTLLVRALDEVNGTGSGWETSTEDEEAEAQGMQVGLTLVGDFCQLPPVKAPFAFESPEWGRFEASTLNLTEVRRQADPEFVEALRAVRRGQPRAALEVLRDCLADKTLAHYDGPTLLAKNDAVDRYNGLRLDALKGETLVSRATRWGTLRPEWKNVPPELVLKAGALVMVLANRYDHEESRYLYVNGDLGVFEGFEGTGARVTLHRTGAEELVAPIVRENLQPLEVGERKALKAAGELERIKGKNKVVGAVRYLPLRVAYATTVHKSQGLSLDSVQVNLREPFMAAPGMVYVALSRARTQGGLRIVGSAETFLARCVADKRLEAWL